VLQFNPVSGGGTQTWSIGGMPVWAEIHLFLMDNLHSIA
jgi:hypothetical protein